MHENHQHYDKVKQGFQVIQRIISRCGNDDDWKYVVQAIEVIAASMKIRMQEREEAIQGVSVALLRVVEKGSVEFDKAGEFSNYIKHALLNEVRMLARVSARRSKRELHYATHHGLPRPDLEIMIEQEEASSLLGKITAGLTDDTDRNTFDEIKRHVESGLSYTKLDASVPDCTETHAGMHTRRTLLLRRIRKEFPEYSIS